VKKNAQQVLISLTLVLLLGSNCIHFNPLATANEDKATVYVVLGCDLEPDQDHTQSAQRPTFTVDTIRPGSSSVVGQIMDSDFRNALKDSFDNMLKMSWFVEMDPYMAAGIWPQQENVSGFGALLETMRKYWSLQIGTYGDELAYHHHFLYYNGWWRAFYPGIDSLPDTYTFHDDYLDRMILDHNFYPSAFRAGWRWLNENVSRWLNKWLPYDFSGQNSTNACFPYHPQGFNFWRIADATNATEAFIYAAQGLPTILFGSGHNELGDLPSSIEYTHEILIRLSEEFDVQFRYCTAREAVQRYLMDMGYATDVTSPVLSVIRNGDNYALTSNETLWMNHPRVTAKYTDDAYEKIVATPVGTDRWNASVPSWNSEGASLEKIGFAALDVWGNPTTLVITPSYVRDVAVLNVTASSNTALVGAQVELNVTIRNEGNITDTFTVTAYQNQTPIGAHKVANIASDAEVVAHFTWDTNATELGEYVVKAEATPLPGEVDLEDNVYTDGIVKIIAPPTAVFSYSPLKPQPTEEIVFDASASTPNGGMIVNYTWNFDGYIHITTEKVVVHAFNNAGVYNVTLIVADDENLAGFASTLVTVGTVSLASFGYNSALKEGWLDARYHIVGGRYDCPENGYAKEVTVYVKNLGQAKRAKSGLYLPDHDGKISTLIASTEERIIPVGECWQSFNFSADANVLLNANQTYWIVIFVEWAGSEADEHSFLIFADHSSSQDIIGGRWYPYGGFPEVFPLDQTVESSWKLSIYCTYIQLSP
jgi:PKD repeat protein